MNLHDNELFDIEEARDRIGYLEQRVEQLEAMLRPKISFPIELNIKVSPTHQRLIGLLMTLPMVSHEAAYEGLYGDRPQRQRPDIAVLAVHVTAIRRFLLQRFSIGIVTVRGQGWSIKAKDRERLKEILNER